MNADHVRNLSKLPSEFEIRHDTSRGFAGNKGATVEVPFEGRTINEEGRSKWIGASINSHVSGAKLLG